MSNDFGYGIVDEAQKAVGGGRFLQFGKGDKGRTITFRLVSKPEFVTQHWVIGEDGKSRPIKCTGKDCSYCGDDVPLKEKIDKRVTFGWIVIDRDDGTPKIFKGAFMIAKDIKALSEDKDWGNPMLYDIKVTRTEEAGAYYKTVPVPKGMGTPITKDEEKAVKEAKFNLKDEMGGSKKSENIGNYEDLETVSKEDTPKGKEVKAEVPVDDIPF